MKKPFFSLPPYTSSSTTRGCPCSPSRLETTGNHWWAYIVTVESIKKCGCGRMRKLIWYKPWKRKISLWNGEVVREIGARLQLLFHCSQLKTRDVIWSFEPIWKTRKCFVTSCSLSQSRQFRWGQTYNNNSNACRKTSLKDNKYFVGDSLKLEQLKIVNGSQALSRICRSVMGLLMRHWNSVTALQTMEGWSCARVGVLYRDISRIQYIASFWNIVILQ